MQQAELAAANKRIRELETEVAILKRARELLRVGADARSATDWDKGIIINRGQIYPDGRIVRYRAPTLVGVMAERMVRAIGGSVDLNKVEKVIDSRYLRLGEREQVKGLHRTGVSIRKIAAELRRSPSTVSRS